MYNKLLSMLCSANLPAPWFVLCSGLLSVNKQIVSIRPLSHCANDRERDLTEVFFSFPSNLKWFPANLEVIFLLSTSTRAVSS